MGSILIGNENIPVIKHFEMTGAPTNNNVPTINDFDTTLEELFAVGKLVAEGSQPPRSEGTIPSNSCDWSDGTTLLENNGRLIFNVTWEAATYGRNYSGTMMLGEQEPPSTYSSYTRTATIIEGYSGTTARGYLHKVCACAGSFDYTVNNQKTRKGYVVLIIEEVTAYDSTQIISKNYFNTGIFYILLPQLNAEYNQDFYIRETIEPEEDNPFDPSEPMPYNPTFDDTSDTIDLPSDPVVGVTGAGFINVYRPSMGQLQGLGDILFPAPSLSQDVATMLLTLCETIANQNLINYVIDCHVIPVTPPSSFNAHIKIGYRDTGISVPAISTDYVNVSCGTLSIAEYFAAFQDYITKSKLYLPFIGFVDMKPEFWQAGVLGVDYKFNIIDGSFMCYVRSTSSKSRLAGSVIAQYAGNACMHFPITGINYANMVSGLVGSAIAASTSQGSSGVLGAAWSAANTLAQGGNVQQSNGYNSTAALLGVRTPYLMIERPVPSVPSYYNHDKGYPSNITTQLSNITGYTEIENIDLSGIPLTQTELEELRSLLAEGVYF